MLEFFKSVAFFGTPGIILRKFCQLFLEFNYSQSPIWLVLKLTRGIALYNCFLTSIVELCLLQVIRESLVSPIAYFDL